MTHATAPDQPEPLEPNETAVIEYLKMVFGEVMTGDIEIAFNRPDQDAVNQARRFPVEDLEQAAEFAIERNREGSNIYVGVAPRKPGGTGRANSAEVLPTNLLFVDIDRTTTLEEIAELWKPLKPTIYVVTGTNPHPRLHLYFNVDTTITDPREVERLNQVLIDHFGGDTKCKNPDRVLRVPGLIAWPTPRKADRVPELTSFQIVDPEPKPIEAIERAYGGRDASFEMGTDETTVKTLPCTAAPTTVQDIQTELVDAFGFEQSADGIVRDITGRVVNGRETHMSKTAFNALVQYIQINGCGPTARQLFELAWPTYERTTRTRGKPLEADGRGETAMRAKCVSKLKPASLERAHQEAAKRFAGAQSLQPSNDNDLNSGEGPHLNLDIAATPYISRGISKISRRDFLYARRLIRKYISVTVSPGGMGKSSLVIGEALDMVTGKGIYNDPVTDQPLRVWVFNLEDPLEELERRIEAIKFRFNISDNDIGGRLFVNSGRDQPLVIAETTRDGATIVRPLVEALIEEIRRQEIDVLIVDPFISSHNVSENDNTAMDMVAKEWNRVADKGGCAIELVHHTRKLGVEQVNTESARGAKALTDTARSVRVLNQMTVAEGLKFGVENHWNYIQTRTDKANFGPRSDQSDWFEMEEVVLMNGNPGPGDRVGVLVPRVLSEGEEEVTKEQLSEILKEAGARNYRRDSQADEWFGHVVARILGLDAEKGTDRRKIKFLIESWEDTGLLFRETRRIDGKDRPCLVTRTQSAPPDHGGGEVVRQ